MNRGIVIMRSSFGFTNLQSLLLPGLAAGALLTTLTSSPARGDCAGPWRSGPVSTTALSGSDKNSLLDPASTHVCVLTRVSGKFVGGGESVRVVVGNDDRWHLEAVSHQSGPLSKGVSGTARCFCKDGFVANGPERWNSAPFEATDLFPQTKAWNGDAATFISGVNGHLRGGGEHARIVQSSNGSKPSELRIGSAAGDLKAWAQSFFAGKPGIGTRAKFFKEKFTEEFTMNHVVSLRSKVMAPTESAMCYFTLIKGKFDTTGDFAEIVPQTIKGKEFWVLQAQRATEVPFLGAAPHATGEIFVAARCYLRNQS